MKTPVPGEVWVRPSFPVPTVVSVLAVGGEMVTVRYGRSKPVEVPCSVFLEQGFRKKEP